MPSWRQGIFIILWALIYHGLVYWFARQLPYSAYYQMDEAKRETQLERLRAASVEALTDLRAWKTTKGPLFDRPEAKKICVGVISYESGVRRTTEMTLGALLSRMHASQQDRIRVVLFNADDNEEAERVSDLVRVEDVDYPEHYPKRRWVIQKKAKRLLDHALILRKLYKMNCEYALVLGDDAVAGEDWARKLLDLVDDVGPDPGWVVLRLMSEYGKVGYTIHEPGDFLLMLSFSALLFLVVWGITLSVTFFVNAIWFEDLSRPSILTVVLLLASFYVGFILMGKPNFPPMKRNDVRLVDTKYLAVANLYPKERLKEYAVILEEHYNDMRLFGALDMLKSHDKLYPRLKKKLEREEGNSFHVATLAPNLFQRVAAIDPLIGVANTVISYDWPDSNRPIRFDKVEFLESNPRRIYPDVY